VQEAWGVLRDEGKRAQYDRMRQAGFRGSGAEFEDASVGGSSGFGTPWGQPSMDERDFEAAFDAWWKKKSEE
jgi:DnaJ-class molecular chaperone